MFHSHKRSLLTLMAASIGIAALAQKTGTPNGWHLKDRAKDSLYGISLDKAYSFVKGKKSQTVIVAVIDSGIDTLHEDLKPILWRNAKEIAGNGIDDDKNGYIDDVNGWNFIGGKDGRNVKEDSYEVARVYHAGKAKYEGADVSKLPPAERRDYTEWLRAKQEVLDGANPAETVMLQKMYPSFKTGDSLLRIALKKEEYNGNDLKDLKVTDPRAAATRGMILQISKANDSYEITNQQLLGELEGQLRKADAANVAPPNYRGDIVKDNEADINDRYYGNNDIMANTPFHGTHVSGIIAAVRNNGKGIDGIADNVRIMTIRAVPDGDEHDKDIALAIRYAVDNGAKIINMSFGKAYSPQKAWVDDAVRYAQKKGVLLVHAAGNDAKNVDTTFNFPTPVMLSGAKPSNWLTIGASGDPKNGGLAASFSNYGKKEVDVFSPGVAIYSTVPGGNTYGNASGTSMASPVTAGVAAFLLSYYPTLSAEQLKYVLENSAIKTDDIAPMPGTGEDVVFSELSKPGGLLNASEAVKLADQVVRSGGKLKTTSNGVEKKVKCDKNETKVKTESKTEKKKEKYKSF